MVYFEKQSTKTIRNSWRRSRGRGPHNIDGEGYPKVLGTEQCPSSSGDGRNRCPTGTAGSSGWSPNRFGDLLCGNICHGRVSIERGHRGM